MSKRQMSWLLLSLFVFAAAMLGPVYAQSGQSRQGSHHSEGTVAPESSPATQGNLEPVLSNDGGGSTQRAEGTPWGSIVASFIAGLVAGGLFFRGSRTGRTVITDRDIHRNDFRRSA